MKLFILSANTDPQRASIFTKGPSNVLDHATGEIASGSKLGIDTTKRIPVEGFKRLWPPLSGGEGEGGKAFQQLMNGFHDLYESNFS